MSRTGIVILAVILAMPGTVSAQGLLDSILGQGGTGVMGPQPGQFDSPQYYGGSMNAAPAYPQQPYGDSQYGGGSGQRYGYPQNQGYANNQSGFYPDWYYSQPPAGPQAAPPAQYSGPPPVQYSAPQAARPPQQRMPVQQVMPPQQPMPAQQMAYPQGAAAQPAAPIQYPPDRGFDNSFQFDETLPAGAVRVTTSTPDGTTVQYYPPTGDTEMMPPAQPPVPQNQRVQRPGPRRIRAGQTQAATRGQTRAPKQASSIAMPKPVEIPQGQDPRTGWSGTYSTGTTGPAAR